jgi:hypothetical protein
MPPKKKEKVTLRGGQLLARGDVIRIKEQGTLIVCRVLSCITAGQESCHATLEVLEGERKGERINATLRPGSEAPEGTSGEPA